MAQINNQAILQKIIDELGLYPGVEAVPTELADKILPVFQVNSEKITVRPPFANVVRDVSVAGINTATIYTTPATGKFYLSSIQMTTEIATIGKEEGFAKIACTIDGNIRILANLFVGNLAGEQGHQNESMTFPNPILIDPGTNITIKGDSSDGNSKGCITGYTEED